MPQALMFTPEQLEQDIEAVVPLNSGPWEVTIFHRLFSYSPIQGLEAGEATGHHTARRGETITLHGWGDYVRGMRLGAFLDPDSPEIDIPEDAGTTARPDLVEFVASHKVDDVIAAAGGDADVAALLLDAERVMRHPDDPRKGVAAGLQAIIEKYMDPGTPVEPSLEGVHGDVPPEALPPGFVAGTDVEPPVEPPVDPHDGDGDGADEEE